MKRYSEYESRTTHHVAKQIWPVLVFCAVQRRTITYKRLCEITKWGSPRTFASVLHSIWRYCEDEDLPVLTTVVVNETTGQCGNGLQLPDVDAERARVYAMGDEWFDVIAPTARAFERVLEAA